MAFDLYDHFREIDLSKAELYADSNRGVFIPQFFAESVKADCLANVKAEDLEVLKAGPDAEWYWESWDAVMDSAILTDPTNGRKFTLYQDGDLWMVPIE